MVESIQDMHYDFKQKLNKIDSNAYRNLRIPEIDWKLREAEGIYIKMIAFPLFKNMLGFEIDQRAIDDIRTIVEEQLPITTVPFDANSFAAPVPTDYLFYISADAQIVKGNCSDNTRVRLVQHDDTPEESPFDQSNFEWREVNARFYGNSTSTPGSDYLRVFTDGTFTIPTIELNYIRRPAFMQFAQGFSGGQYNLPDGTVISGVPQDCELPVQTRSEIVDLAVLIVTGELMIPDYKFKQGKLQMAMN